MTLSAVLVVLALAALAVCAMALMSLRRRAETESAALRQEMQALAGSQSQAVTAQFAQLSQSFTAQLAQVTQQVQTGMASVGTLATGAQKAVSDQLRASTEMLGTIRQQLGEDSLDPDQTSHPRGGCLVIARKHDDVEALGLELGNGPGTGRAYRIGDRDDADHRAVQRHDGRRAGQRR